MGFNCFSNLPSVANSAQLLFITQAGLEWGWAQMQSPADTAVMTKAPKFRSWDTEMTNFHFPAYLASGKARLEEKKHGLIIFSLVFQKHWYHGEKALRLTPAQVQPPHHHVLSLTTGTHTENTRSSLNTQLNFSSAPWFLIQTGPLKHSILKHTFSKLLLILISNVYLWLLPLCSLLLSLSNPSLFFFFYLGQFFSIQFYFCFQFILEHFLYQLTS